MFMRGRVRCHKGKIGHLPGRRVRCWQERTAGEKRNAIVEKISEKSASPHSPGFRVGGNAVRYSDFNDKETHVKAKNSGSG